MKKFAALFLALMMVFSMVAIAETKSPAASPEKPGTSSPSVSPEAGDKPGSSVVPSPGVPSPGVPGGNQSPSTPTGGFAVDTFTSASVSNYYADAALVGDDLMNAVNSQSGFYLVCTTNPDGSPNAGYFIFAIKKLNDKYYIQLGLAENQSKLNLEANGLGLAVYAADPGVADKAYSVAGARFYFKAIEDQAIVDELMKDARQGAMFFEITDVLPLG